MGLKDSITSAENLTPKLTQEQIISISRAETLLDSITILRAIRKENCKFNCMPPLTADVELCRQLRSQELLRNIKK